MTASRILTPINTLRNRATVMAAVGAIGLGAGLVATAPAQAQPRDTGAGQASCAIEIDGKTTTVPEGTRVGIFVCGHDGEWHFGWLINDVASASPKGSVQPVISVMSTGQAQLARVARR